MAIFLLPKAPSWAIGAPCKITCGAATVCVKLCCNTITVDLTRGRNDIAGPDPKDAAVLVRPGILKSDTFGITGVLEESTSPETFGVLLIVGMLSVASKASRDTSLSEGFLWNWPRALRSVDLQLSN